MKEGTQAGASGEVRELECIEQPNCVACGEGGETALEGLEDRLSGVSGLWSISSCPRPSCGTAWLNPRPVDADLSLAYKSYFTHGARALESKKMGLFGRGALKLLRLADSLIRRALGIDSARRRLNELFADREGRGSLLEVGCGDGARLSKWAEMGWEVLGQVVDSNAVETALERGVNVKLGDLKSLSLSSGQFDMVAGNHVVEHVSEPAVFLSECYRLLKPGGVLVLTNPNPESRGRDRWGGCWFGWDPPRHLNLFTPAGLGRLTEGAGFETERAFTSSVRAHSFARGSIENEEFGGHVMGRQVHWWVYLRALVFLYSSWLSFRDKSGSGEETVLIVRRPELET